MSTITQSRKTGGYEDLGRVVAATFAVVFWLPVLFLKGLVVSYLWLWFLTPVVDVPAPGFVACSGLCLLWSVLTSHKGPDRENTEEEKALAYSEAVKLSVAVLALLLAWGVGWAVHLFV